MRQLLIFFHLACVGSLTRGIRLFTRKDRVLLNENTKHSFDCLGDQATMRGIVTGYLCSDPGVSICVMSHTADQRWLDIAGVQSVAPVVRSIKLGQLWSMVRAVASARYVHYLAGDSVDGKYGVGVRGWAWRYYGWAGVEIIITSFSFNETPTRRALDAIDRLPRNTRFTIRDQRSIDRFTRLTGRPHHAVADAAFMLPPEPDEIDAATRAFIEAQRAAGRTVAAININRHVIPDASDRVSVQPAIEATAEAIARLSRDRPVSWVTLPHDSRGSISDENIAVWLADAVPQDARPYVQAAPMMSSGGVKATTAMVDLVVTGRMHLAIASLGSGTPVLAFTYQDKFEGLFDYFGFRDNTLDPAEGMTSMRILRFIDEGINDCGRLKAQLTKTLPSVQTLAKHNILNA